MLPPQQIENNRKRDTKNDSSHGIDLICTPGNLVTLITITWQPSITVQVQPENTDRLCVQVLKEKACINVVWSSGPQPDFDNMKVATFWGEGEAEPAVQCHPPATVT